MDFLKIAHNTWKRKGILEGMISWYRKNYYKQSAERLRCSDRNYDVLVNRELCKTIQLQLCCCLQFVLIFRIPLCYQIRKYFSCDTVRIFHSSCLLSAQKNTKKRTEQFADHTSAPLGHFFLPPQKNWALLDPSVCLLPDKNNSIFTVINTRLIAFTVCTW